MKNKFKIIMLPTKNATKLTFQTGIGLSLSDIEKGGNSAWKNQHLYILSNDHIEEGDWVLFCNYGTLIFDNGPYKVSSCNNESVRKNNDIILWNNEEGSCPAERSQCAKIIASTDEEITPKSLIPESLIIEYISTYNSGNPIHEVCLEQEEINDRNNYEWIVGGDFKIITKIKTDKNGYIIVNPTTKDFKVIIMEDNSDFKFEFNRNEIYTQEEVVLLFQKYYMDCIWDPTPDGDQRETSIVLSEWIEKNITNANRL